MQRTWAVAEIKIKRMLDTMVLASSYHFIILTYRTTIDSRPQTVHIVRLHCRSRQLQEDGMQRILSEIETEHTQHGSNNYKSSIPVLICTYSIRHWSADVPNVDTLAVYKEWRKATEESRFMMSCVFFCEKWCENWWRSLHVVYLSLKYVNRVFCNDIFGRARDFAKTSRKSIWKFGL